MAEAGVPGYVMDFWFGIVAPAGTPDSVVQRLSHEIALIEKQPTFRQRLVAFPIQYETSTPQQMGATIKEDIVRWQKYLRDYKVEPQ